MREDATLCDCAMAQRSHAHDKNYMGSRYVCLRPKRVALEGSNGIENTLWVVSLGETQQS